MKAKKGNRVYKVDENTKGAYLAQGFDIINDKGKVLEHGAGKKISVEAYNELLAELEALKAEKAGESKDKGNKEK